MMATPATWHASARAAPAHLPAIQAPHPARLLDAWEAGTGQPLAWGALLLLMAAYPTAGADALLAWPVGRRDLHLLALRAACFGPQIESIADCPACGERLEVVFDVADVVAPQASAAPDPLDAGQDPCVTVDWDGRALQFRLPAAGDLIALARCAGAGEGRQLLLHRCSLDASPDDVDALPAAVVEALAQHLSDADPQADVRLALACPACAHTWLAAFDIAGHLWAELDEWAWRTLRQVHALARAYGWREEETLSLSPRRRQHYLDLINSGDGEPA